MPVYTSIPIGILMKLTKLTGEEERRTRVVEYIINHQGCNVQDVIRGVERYVSRVTVFNIIESLEKVGAIRKQKDKPNSRDHKLFADSNNPLISLPKEFEEFKEYYYPLLKAIKEQAKEYSEDNIAHTGRYFGYLARLGLIFSEFVRIYDTRALLVWPKQIRDTESLKNLYILFYSEVLEILDEINKVFSFLFSDLGAPRKEGFFASIGLGLLERVPASISKVRKDFSGTYMETEANRVLEHVQSIWEKDHTSYKLKFINSEEFRFKK
jgi:Fe2+ or Zn2+ uptake regulation protein